MPRYHITSPDGKEFEIDAPDGATEDDAINYFRSTYKHDKPITAEQHGLAHPLARLGQGVIDPLIGTGQLIAHGVSALAPEGTALSGLANSVDSYWANEKNKADEAKKALNVGTDVAGIVGNIISPANAILSAKGIPAAASLGEKVLQGAGLGALGGAMQPVQGNNYAIQKAAQVGLGAAAGGGMAGILSKASDKLAKLFKPEDIESLGSKASIQADDAITQSFNDAGVDTLKIDANLLAQLRDEILDGLKNGKQIDAAALLRKKDFESLNIQPLQGQITRDPTQFSQERNLRGAIPEIANVMQVQGQQLRNKLGEITGQADEAYSSGNKIIDALRGIDDAKKSAINQLYGQAKDSSGRYANVNAKQFSEMANNALDSEMLGHYLPTETRNLLNDISSGKIPLTVNNLVQADTVLSQAQRKAGHGTPEALAIGKVRDALNNADIDGSAGQEAKYAFDTARKAAKARFAEHEAIPALKAVAENDAVPDNFARKFIIQEKSADNVKRMANALRNTDEKAFNEAKSQLGAEIQRAAYGENAAGDSALTPERLSKALRNIGNEKLKAFFSDKEIETLQKINRVGAYINKVPDASSVNYSNSATSLLGNLPLLKNGSVLTSTLKAGANAVKNQMLASKSINAKVPVKDAPLTPEQAKIVSMILTGGSAFSGISAAEMVK